MNESPLVSIIIPAYNCAKYIPETLSSLFEQDYPNTEIIVVNDGSKDNTLELLQTYGDRIVLINQVNTGAPGARNAGIRVAHGEFISFCDSDDLWARQKVRAQVAYLNSHSNVGMVYCKWCVWEPDSDGKFIIPPFFYDGKDSQEIDPLNSGWIYHKLLLDCICLTSSVMFRREIMAKIGFFSSELWNGDDYDYWLRTSRITEIHKLISPLVLYRILPQSVARTPTKIHYEYEVLKNAISRWGTVSPDGRKNDVRAIGNRIANMLFSFGFLHFKSGDPVIAVRSFMGSIKYKPFWYLPWAYLLMSFWKRIVNMQARSSARIS
jgi:glycosyltransferase involved in cell wall biosynthesis